MDSYSYGNNEKEYIEKKRPLGRELLTENKEIDRHIEQENKRNKSAIDIEREKEIESET